MKKMENLKKMMVMLTCMGILAAFSSCLDDDDNNNSNNELTPSQKSAQIFEMAGTYNGHLFFYNDTTSPMKLDSIACLWHLSANDSVLSIPNFPVAVLANGISDEDTKKCLLDGGTTAFTATLHPYYSDSNNKGIYSFWMLANNDKMEFTINQDGVDHSVKADLAYQMYPNSKFGAIGNFYSVGEYQNNEMISYILVYDVVFDGKSYVTAWPLYTLGKK